MVEPVMFPAKDTCEHRFCNDCMQGLFSEDEETAKYTHTIVKACPLCRAEGRVRKDHRDEILCIDEEI